MARAERIGNVAEIVALHLLRQQAIERAIRRLNRRKVSSIGAADVVAEVLRRDAGRQEIESGSFDELQAAAAEAMRRRWRR